jgi:hypothetical protein
LSENGYPIRPPKSSRVVIGQNRHGEWVALDPEGRCGGVFTNRDAAYRFALDVNGRRLDAIKLVKGTLELTTGPAPALRSQGTAVGTVVSSLGKSGR